MSVLLPRLAAALEQDQTGADVLVNRLQHNLVLSLQVVNTVLLVGKLPTTL